MANKTKYPFVKMKPGEFQRLHFNKKMDAARAQMVCYCAGRNKGFKFKTEIVNFMLEVTRVS